MSMVHLRATRERRDDIVREAAQQRLIFQCTNADTVIVAASMAEQWHDNLGVWLVISEDYPAQIAARDVATLASLVSLRHVVVEAASLAAHHAEVLRALLTNDEVNFANDVATLAGAYNRPAPPVAITVWHEDGEWLVGGDQALHLLRRETSAIGDFAYYA